MNNEPQFVASGKSIARAHWPLRSSTVTCARSNTRYCHGYSSKHGVAAQEVLVHVNTPVLPALIQVVGCGVARQMHWKFSSGGWDAHVCPNPMLSVLAP